MVSIASKRNIGVAAALTTIVVAVFFLPRTELTGSVNDAFMLTFSVIVESLPFLILGVGLSAIVQAYVPASWFVRFLPSNKTIRRSILSLLGVLFPVCECGNLPMSRGLIRKGLRTSESVTFLLAAPVLNPITVVTTIQAFGWNWWIIGSRILGGFIIANFIGWFVENRMKENSLLTESFAASCEIPEISEKKNVRSLLWNVQHELIELFPTLVIGATIAGLVQVAVKREWLVSVGSDTIFSVFAMLALAIIVSICSNVDSFFALSFASTFTSGALVTFLLASPLIDFKMIALMRTTFSNRLVVVIIAITVLFSITIGMGVNLVTS